MGRVSDFLIDCQDTIEIELKKALSEEPVFWIETDFTDDNNVEIMIDYDDTECYFEFNINSYIFDNPKLLQDEAKYYEYIKRCITNLAQALKNGTYKSLFGPIVLTKAVE